MWAEGGVGSGRGRLPMAMFVQRFLPPASLPWEKHIFWSICMCIFSQFVFAVLSIGICILSAYIHMIIDSPQRNIKIFNQESFDFFGLSLSPAAASCLSICIRELWKHSLTFSPFLYLHSYILSSCLFVSKKETSSFVSFSFSALLEIHQQTRQEEVSVNLETVAIICNTLLPITNNTLHKYIFEKFRTQRDCNKKSWMCQQEHF